MEYFPLLLNVCLLIYLNIGLSRGDCEVVSVSSQSDQISVSIWINATNDRVIGYFTDFEKSTDCITLVPERRTDSSESTFFGKILVNYRLSNVDAAVLRIRFGQNGFQNFIDDFYLLKGDGNVWLTYSRRLALDWTDGVSFNEAVIVKVFE